MVKYCKAEVTTGLLATSSETLMLTAFKKCYIELMGIIGEDVDYRKAEENGCEKHRIDSQTKSL